MTDGTETRTISREDSKGQTGPVTQELEDTWRLNLRVAVGGSLTGYDARYSGEMQEDG